MPLEITAAESTRQLMERLRTERLERMRSERAQLERERVEEQRAESARQDRELAERAAAENWQSEVLANRIEARVRAEDIFVERQTDRYLAERARIEAQLAYTAQAPRADSYAQFDVQQVERIQATRDTIERADATRMDRILLSDRALAELQFI